MNERNFKMLLGTPDMHKSSGKKMRILQCALPGSGHEYENVVRVLASEPISVMDFQGFEDVLAPKMTFDRVRLIESFIDLIASPSIESPQKRYHSLADALEGRTDWDPQAVKRVGATALTPLQEETQEIVTSSQHEYQVARLDLRQRIIGFKNPLA
jgi:hypothetical protein